MSNYPNTGSLWPNKKKQNERSPNVYGSIKLDPTFLSDLMDSAEGDLVEISLAGWTKNYGDTKFVSLKASEPQKKQEKSNDDGQDEIPF